MVFPNPELAVDCGVIVIPESCPAPIAITVDGCEDSMEFDAGELGLESLGRIVQLDVTLRNVCPNKRVALAVLLNEVDGDGNEYKRGMKTIVVPAHTSDSYRDVTVRCIKFVLPESLDLTQTPDSMCDSRNLRARFIANYIDNDFDCCEVVL